jgi:hypothetical protein
MQQPVVPAAQGAVDRPPFAPRAALAPPLLLPGAVAHTASSFTA